MKKIIVKFDGGLGNQMSQYVLYCLLRDRYPQYVIKADLSRYKYNKYKIHDGFQIDDIFESVDLDEASLGEILISGGRYERRKKSIFDFIAKNVWNIFFRRFFMKRCIEYGKSSNITELEAKLDKYSNVWIYNDLGLRLDDGSLFRFKKISDMYVSNLVNEMNASESVSLHVRRGDYVELGIDTVSVDYCHKAMEMIESRLDKSVHYFLFSDDPEWLIKNFSDYPNVSICDKRNIDKNYYDMYLMSQCKHNIICNSTFSMWAAYINRNPDKIVIYPESWFADNIYGENWIPL